MQRFTTQINRNERPDIDTMAQRVVQYIDQTGKKTLHLFPPEKSTRSVCNRFQLRLFQLLHVVSQTAKGDPDTLEYARKRLTRRGFTVIDVDPRQYR